MTELENIRSVINAMAGRVAELNQQLDMLSCFVQENDPSREGADGRDELGLPLVREEKLKAALKEAIEELEESRKSFKSKRLELLRKKLTRTLMDLN